MNVRIEEERKRRIEEMSKKYNAKIEEIKQIEEWSGMKMKEVFFDSNKPEDKWSENDCNFNEKIEGKKQFVVVIEDTEGNKFGCYYNTEVRNVVGKDQRTDSKTFAFSLQSNGRCYGMTRFNINELGKNRGFYLNEKESFDCEWIISSLST